MALVHIDWVRYLTEQLCNVGREKSFHFLLIIKTRIMEISTQYYLKAMGNYPYDLDVVVENLQYAISYDPEHAQALCLMGQVQMYFLKDFSSAKSYLQQALAADMDYPVTYRMLSLLHIWLGDYASAEKIISFGFKVKGQDLCAMMRVKASLYECQRKFADAKKLLKEAVLMTRSQECMDHVAGDINRVKAKQKQLKSMAKLPR